MNNKSTKVEVIIPLLTILSDSISIFGAFIISYWLRFLSPLAKYLGGEVEPPPVIGYLGFALITIPIAIFIFQQRKMYRIKRTVFIFDEFFIVVKYVSIYVIFCMSLIFFYRDFPYSRMVFGLLWVSCIIFMTLGRYILLKYEKNLYNKGTGLVNTAIFGMNEMAMKIYDQFVKDKYAGYKIVGYFTYDNDENMLEGRNHLGSYTEIPSVIRKKGIQKILIVLPPEKHIMLEELMKLSEGINIEFMLAPDFIEMITSRLRIEEVNGIPFMKIKSVPMNIWNRFVKRCFDIIASFFFLVITSPVMILLSLLVKFTSKGPLFYKQERVSINGRKFNMLKFRSMKIDAEKSGPQMTSVNDDRYTPIGKTLRKYSLDELPQFLNVLKGDMSIVGPRPEREHFINTMKDTIDKYLERHRVKSGITGWAQVNGLRGTDTPLQTRIEYDIYYIENWSLVFDIKIIIKTIREMFFSKTAF
ncbi:MAG: undecaprenyl-phosphate glucose phosphotransferase [Bacteroidetes bacterium]|nr:undecaprenyl-phosphate glucose phosphotransferase [Bacteroidota bacterium]